MLSSLPDIRDAQLQNLRNRLQFHGNLYPARQGELTVRLWDFAGQEITHALHQFFLTEGCVYLLVLDPRSNTEMQDAEYWLGLLQRYAGNSPVLLVLNRQDASRLKLVCETGWQPVLRRRAHSINNPQRRGFEPRGCDRKRR